MHLTRKAIGERIKDIDVVIEMLDARLPGSSANPMLAQLIQGKPGLKVLSKQDLADAERTQLWLDHYNAMPNVRAIGLDTSMVSPTKALVDACQQLAPHRGGMVKPMRVQGSPIQFECVYLNSLRFPGKPPMGTADVVFGRVVAIHIDDDALTGALVTAARKAGFADIRPVVELRGKVQVGHVASVSLFGADAARTVSGFFALGLFASVSALLWAGPRVLGAMGKDLRALREAGHEFDAVGGTLLEDADEIAMGEDALARPARHRRMDVLAARIHGPGARPVMPADDDGRDAVIGAVLLAAHPDGAAGEAARHFGQEVEGAAQHVFFRHRHQRRDGEALRHPAQRLAGAGREALARALVARVEEDDAAIAHEGVECRDGGRLGLARLAGVDPTAGGRSTR